MQLMLSIISAGVMLVMFAAVEPAWAQSRNGNNTGTTPSVKPVNAPVRPREELRLASDEYKSNLEHLVALYVAEATKAEETVLKLNQLLAQGLITRSDVEMAKQDEVRTRQKVVEAQAQLKSVDRLPSDLLVEAETEDSTQLARQRPEQRSSNTFVQTTAYIRYGGIREWSLSQADVIKQFFLRRFGRALPIGAFGQSLLHDRWHYDHRNAMDVGLSPDSNEGQILMNYLRVNGIPFTAFHFAIAGRATGPHIHVGLPSHRMAPTGMTAEARNSSR